MAGNRLSVCLPSINTHLNNSSIAIFNCFMSHLTMTLFSVSGIIGLIMFLRHERRFNWLFMPLLFSFAFHLVLFQQSYAAHIYGYSLIFAFCYTLGNVFLFFKLAQKISISNKPLIGVMQVLFTLGIVINSIRVSLYLA